MPTPWERDLDATRVKLADWLRKKLPDATSVEISELTAPESSGFSNETLLFDASWLEGGRDRHEKLVVRVQPTGYQVFPEYDMGLQFNCMRLLAPTEIPVPKVFWLEEEDTSVFGSAFYVMQQLEGRAASDNPPYTTAGWLFDSSPEDQARVWWACIENIAKIVKLDWRALGFEWLDRPKYGRTGIDQQLGYYEHYLEWAADGRPQPTIENALRWLRENQPTGESVHLNWGDARIGNILFDGSTPVAVLDWEMATLGGPEVDLGWMFFLYRFHTDGYGVPPLPGFPSREETLSRFAALSGHEPRHLHYYEVFGGMRFAIVMLRIAQQQTHYGGLDEASGRALELDNPVSQQLAVVSNQPAPRSWVEQGI